MKIYIPHLHYTVNVKTFKKPPEETPNAKRYVESIDGNTSNMYLPEKNTPTDIAHELIHILQNICLNRNIDFSTETEHMGYLMQWLMGKILGYEYK